LVSTKELTLFPRKNWCRGENPWKFRHFTISGGLAPVVYSSSK